MKGFTFTENYYAIISDEENGLTDDEKAHLYKALIDYIFAGVEPEFKGVMRAVFYALLPVLNLSKIRSKAKQNKIKPKSNQNQRANKTETNENQNKIKIETKKGFDFQEKSPLIKEKVTQKENINPLKEEDNSLPPIIPRNAQERFFTEFQIVVDNYDVGIMSGWTEADWANLAEQFRKSEWLRKNVKTTSMLCRLSTRILAGAYAPFEKVQAGRGSEILEEERRENADWFDRNFGDVE